MPIFGLWHCENKHSLIKDQSNKHMRTNNCHKIRIRFAFNNLISLISLLKNNFYFCPSIVSDINQVMQRITHFLYYVLLLFHKWRSLLSHLYFTLCTSRMSEIEEKLKCFTTVAKTEEFSSAWLRYMYVILMRWNNHLLNIPRRL